MLPTAVEYSYIYIRKGVGGGPAKRYMPHRKTNHSLVRHEWADIREEIFSARCTLKSGTWGSLVTYDEIASHQGAVALFLSVEGKPTNFPIHSGIIPKKKKKTISTKNALFDPSKIILISMATIHFII